MLIMFEFDTTATRTVCWPLLVVPADEPLELELDPQAATAPALAVTSATAAATRTLR
jgi:hypothetical protein